jgi:hypothetical protein
MLDVLFPLNRCLDILVVLDGYQPFQTVSFGEAYNDTFSVLPYATG